MPYPIAHPAAVLPLFGLMGRWSVPSALVIGSIVPDLWYFVPLAPRAASHSAAGLLFFCLPYGLVAYLTFHSLLKRPLAALLPARLAPFMAKGIPRRPWRAVLLCLLVGSATHLAWDSFTHEHGLIVEKFPAFQVQIFAIGSYRVHLFQLLQHASTLLGVGFVCWWTWRAFNRLPANDAACAFFALKTRLLIAGALLALSAGWAAWQASVPSSFDPLALRTAVRSAGLAAAEALALGVLAYSLATTWLLGRSRAPRSPGGR
jgi:hypothetical protein